MADKNDGQTAVSLRALRMHDDSCVRVKRSIRESGRAMTHFAVARILIVDDSPDWRARVHEILAVHPEWKIISEASDGQEAVQEASELQPDIVVLDISMPRLNGIEAAKMVRQKSPKSRIVFLTVENDSDIMKAALDVGQATYVTKANAATRLCEAVAASLRGNLSDGSCDCPLVPTKLRSD